MKPASVRRLGVITALALLLLAACETLPGVSSNTGKTLQSPSQRELSPVVDAAAVQALVDGNTAFATDLYSAVSPPPGNLFFSPYSLSAALAMTYAGARGQTEAQMAATLHFPAGQEALHPAFNALDLQITGAGVSQAAGDAQPFELSIANSLWAQQDYEFLPEYLHRVAVNYGAGLRLLDFGRDSEGARQTINRWVEEQTREKIKNLIPENGLDPATRLVLANAIYFKADWLHPFEPANTRPLAFHLLDGGEVETPMMAFERPKELPYFEVDSLQAVELPYLGEQVSMLLLVPDEGRFAEFEAGLDVGVLQTIVAGLKSTKISLLMPKFEYTSNFQLDQTLSGMGMPDAFCSGSADFSGMDGRGGLCIAQVFHKAFVAVDEKGTEAAAASAVAMAESAMIIEELVEMRIDRPFIFFIRHNQSGSVLFMGRVVDPSTVDEAAEP